MINDVPTQLPKGSMRLVYLPTFFHRQNHPWIGKYTARPVDPMCLKKSSESPLNSCFWFP